MDLIDGRSIRLFASRGEASHTFRQQRKYFRQSLHTMLFACHECEALGGEAAQEPTRDGRQVTG